MMPGMTVYPIAFYELLPQYECKNGDIWTECSQEDFCLDNKLDPTVDFRVKESLYSIDNWVKQYNLTCSSRKTIGSIGTLYFLGMILGSLVVPKLSDVYGRKPIVLVATVVQILALCMNLLGTDINMLLLMHFCQGVSWCGRGTVGYMMMMENVPKSKAVTATTAYYIGNCQAILMALVYFRFMGKDWRVPYAFATIALLPALIHLCLIPETPKYLYGKKKFKECR